MQMKYVKKVVFGLSSVLLVCFCFGCASNNPEELKGVSSDSQSPTVLETSESSELVEETQSPTILETPESSELVEETQSPTVLKTSESSELLKALQNSKGFEKSEFSWKLNKDSQSPTIIDSSKFPSRLYKGSQYPNVFGTSKVPLKSFGMQKYQIPKYGIPGPASNDLWWWRQKRKFDQMNRANQQHQQLFDDYQNFVPKPPKY